MKSPDELKRIFGRIHRKSYKAYKDIEGEYDFGSYDLFIDHVQGDPFAAPSRIRIWLPHQVAGIPPEFFSTTSRSIALEDYLGRSFARALGRTSRGRRGMGTSGLIEIDQGGQHILERSAVVVFENGLEIRFVMGLPAAGRSILGDQAVEMFFTELPPAVEHGLMYHRLDGAVVKAHIDCADDQDWLRSRLAAENLVCFVPDGARLPRMSGVDDRPLDREVVPFASPDELRVGFTLPHHGAISGMGIPRGVSLVVGGGFHGKSTLLAAIELGIYNHLPGDGREFAVTERSAVKVRAEDGRYICDVDISPFITNLPMHKSTVRFSTENASGSTSQAASIMEALEMGSQLLLIDEDTSATNFMIRDRRIQELVAKNREPITPFVDKVEALFRDHGVSTILVMGGSGDYFEKADTVLLLDNYRTYCVTGTARTIAQRFETGRLNEGGESFGSIKPRRPAANSF
ncbi:ABC-ATPase domain-containing protein, partial [bacterium]|nr:ABC-ATPase domain-containing protein [candidate division CSSED10-310 bacterium]